MIVRMRARDSSTRDLSTELTHDLYMILHHTQVCHTEVGPPPQLVPRTICGKLCCRRWSPRTKYGYHGWSALPRVVPRSKPEKQWLQLQIDLCILTDEFEVTIKIFRNNAMHVCCNSESSLAAKTTFLLIHSRIVIWATTG